MASRPASVHTDSVPSPGAHLRLLRRLESDVEDHVRAADERAPARGPFDADCEPLNGLFEKLHDLRDSRESNELWKAANKTCQRLMTSKDPELVRSGMRFFMAIQHLRAKIYSMELELVKHELRQSTQVTIAQIRNSSSARGRGAKGRAASASPRS